MRAARIYTAESAFGMACPKGICETRRNAALRIFAQYFKLKV